MALVEKTLPVQFLNVVALREGNSKRPVYQMHKWWARRLGCVFRTIIACTFSSDGESEEEVWRKVSGDVDLRDKVILDPFMGGGTTIVEAAALGCKAIGVDINPVAWFVTKKEVEGVDIAALDRAFEHLESTAGESIKRFYTTKCPAGHPAEVMYFFWVKTAECGHCGRLVRMFPNYQLSQGEGRAVSCCPRCLAIVTSVGPAPSTCPECGHCFDARQGNSGRGRFRCDRCHTEQRVLDAVQRRGGPLAFELHALEGYCNTCGRFFKRVERDDLLLWQQARAEFARKRESLLAPHQQIPTEGRSDPRPVNHGYKHFRELFNERQLLCLSTLLQEILRLKDRNIREFMLLAFSDCLDANNIFCKYEVDWHKISLFFGLHAYHPIERPAENNVWGTKYGRGTFVKCYEKLRRGKMYAQARIDSRAGDRVVTACKRTCAYRLVEDFEALRRGEGDAVLLSQSGENLSFLPDGSVDAVVTDPPYFDNVQYSELSDFFYVWLRLGLKDDYPWFEPEFSSRPEEIVQNPKLGKTTEFFAERLTRVFRECRRVLKDDGLLVFTFHHNKTWAWETIGHVLLESGFWVSGCSIVRSEGKSGFHSSPGNIRYDCVLACRKRPGPVSPRAWSDVRRAILRDSVGWVRKTMSSGLPLGLVDAFTIVMGKTLEHFTKAFPNVSDRGQPVTLAEALRQMQELTRQVGEEGSATHHLDRTSQRQAQQLRLLMESSPPYEGKQRKQ